MANGQTVNKGGVDIILDRTFKSPTYSIPNRFKVAINTVDVNYGDVALVTEVPISGTEMIDSCSATTGWTASGTNSITVNATMFKPDGVTDGALNIVKSDITSATFSVSKSTTSINGTSKDFTMWFYIKDATALAKLKSSGTCLTIRFGSDNSNYYYKDYTVADLSTGWNFLKIVIPGGMTGTTSTPTITALDYTYIAIITNNITDVFVAGDIIYDAIRAASVDDYYKTVESIAVDETDGSCTILSKLTITEATGFLLNGHAIFNTDVSEKMFCKTKHPSNSKDNTDLFKYTTKIKFRNKT